MTTGAENAPGTSAEEQADASAAGPREQCDLIMKGGITSGIVYPRAVATLHTKYDFNSIGGASAGAIGAALTAAAQYGEYQRRRDPAATGGFGALAETSRLIAEPGLLAGLFQPSHGATWVYRVIFGLQGANGLLAKAWVILTAVVRYFSLQVVVAAGVVSGALAGILYGFGGGLGQPTWYGWLLVALAIAVTSLLGLLGAVLVRALRTVRGLPANFYGVCLGMPEGRAGGPALTPWLHRQIQLCAGRAETDPPLTFRDLAGGAVADERIRLEMMTTDLSAARPLSLPMRDLSFLYSPTEFARLFPADVLTHLERVSTPVTVPATPDGPTDLRTFPGQDLPVIVGTRMSLSFPVLISAVPLWVRGVGGAGPVRHWFSDGGIASNFPMHFFDVWLPSRPTFGLDLVPAPRGEAGQPERAHRQRPSGLAGVRPRTAGQPSAAAAEAAAGAAPQERRVAQITGLVGFLLQILDTMQNWRDTLQAELPGFRDRIRPVHLPEGTGGMHVTMPPEQIDMLAACGKDAGQDFLSTFCWEDHLFARYTLLMRELQQNLVGGGNSASGMVQAFTSDFQQTLTEHGTRTVPGDTAVYTDEWSVSARDRTLALLGLATGWAATRSLSFIQGADPVPPPVMRMGPKI